jgi:poly(3-hydroxyalkanoate) synthetase
MKYWSHDTKQSWGSKVYNRMIGGFYVQNQLSTVFQLALGNNCENRIQIIKSRYGND